MKVRFARVFGLLVGVGLLAQSAGLHSQPAAPAATYPVLALDGKGSYVRLTDNIAHELTEGTVEAWVNWESLGDVAGQRWFGFGAFQDDMGMAGSQFFVNPKGDVHRLSFPGAVEAQTWQHMAAVTGPAA